MLLPSLRPTAFQHSIGTAVPRPHCRLAQPHGYAGRRRRPPPAPASHEKTRSFSLQYGVSFVEQRA
eukprot:1991034-Pleurochrysis_carterae.AAC.1